MTSASVGCGQYIVRMASSNQHRVRTSAPHRRNHVVLILVAVLLDAEIDEGGAGRSAPVSD